ncbi:DUF58 domain-containing protein [Alkalilimnicola ehrlichii MLHE-1]|uniref:Uncharacterized protein n=1 Tax=Alkalilimnicola ehrlichii (strain ATCC BAA-1101 / DSM 17681 / MLHE-1) TaxID=187272 RepID=Q0A7F9_ALKEH|nr:DUF58 domain-containing protein [Alkalilimnicola ehrlichii]ABI57228.1 protein of unknown function DUF58 [Alkalilimnicola ehrlichii MLHE-1]
MSVRHRLHSGLLRLPRRRGESTSDRLTLDYRRIFILPSRYGLFLTLVAALVWLGGVNYTNNMVLLLSFLLIGLIVVSIHHTFRNLHRLMLLAGPADAVFAGQTLHFPVTAHNPTRHGKPALTLVGGEGQQTADLPPGGSVRWWLPVPTHRRGWQTLPRFRVHSRFPTGLFVAWALPAPRQRALVYPTPEHGAVPPPPHSAGGHQGERHGEGDDDFRGLRRYQAGDPKGHIAWKRLARGEEHLHTKQFSGAAGAPRWLDERAIDPHLDPEARLARLCRWVVDLDRAGHPYGLRLGHLRIAPGRGEAHRHACLRALALYDPDARQ